MGEAQVEEEQAQDDEEQADVGPSGADDDRAGSGADSGMHTPLGRATSLAADAAGDTVRARSHNTVGQGSSRSVALCSKHNSTTTMMRSGHKIATYPLVSVYQRLQ